MDNVKLSTVDSIVFAVSLLISAGIGVYYAVLRRNRQTTRDYYVGNRQLGIVPVSLSLFASFISAIAVVGVPAEVYYYGLEMTTYVLAQLVAYPVVCVIYLPVYHRLAEKRDVASAYEVSNLNICRSIY